MVTVTSPAVSEMVAVTSPVVGTPDVGGGSTVFAGLPAGGYSQVVDSPATTSPGLFDTFASPHAANPRRAAALTAARTLIRT